MPLGEMLVCMEQRRSMHTNISPNGTEKRSKKDVIE
jgi:hypothetical protein